MTKYTRDDLLDIYSLRNINIEPSTRKDFLNDGFVQYNKLVRKLLDNIFFTRCGDVYVSVSDNDVEDRIISIKADIARMFSEPALAHLEDQLWDLEKQLSEYTLMLELIKYYRNEIPASVRECTQAKMTEHVINAITKFESSLGLPPYPKSAAISAIKHACGLMPADPSIAQSEKQSLKKMMRTNKYFARIKKYLD